MPGNFGIPNEDASLDALGGVIDANSDALEEIIVAAQYPLTALITDNDCLLDGIAKRAQRLLNTALKSTNTELANIANALVAHLGALTGATQEELNRALALADDAAPTAEDAPEQVALGDVGPDIQDVLEGDAAAGGDFGIPAANQAPAQRQGEQAAGPLAGFGVAGAAAEQFFPPEGVPLPQARSVPCAMGGRDLPLPDIIAQGLPVPGSPAFYDHIDEYIAGFDIIGDQLIAFGVENINKENLRALFQAYKAQNAKRGKNQSLFTQAVVLGAEYLIDHSDTVFEIFTKAVKCAWSLAQILTPQCNLKIVAGVVVCKSILSVLREIQAGWDAFVWAVAKIRVEIPHVENILDHLLAYACPTEVPSPQEATEAWIKGYMDTKKRDTIYRWHGINPEGYKEIAESRGEMLSAHEIIQFLRRAKQDNQTQIDALKSRGFVRPDEAEVAVELYDELPSINDHLHWLQRNVFNDEYTRKYQLDEGFEERFWVKYGADLEAQGYTKERARNEYMAHWIMPSPEQMREFMYRLRPEKVGELGSFTADDYNRILSEQDYSVRARQWFVDTRYRVPALGYLRDMYRQGVIGDDELRGYHQDLGYSHDDSERFVRIDRIQRDRMRATQAHGWNPVAIAKAYATRQRDAEWVKATMADLGYTLNDAIALAERADMELSGQIATRARSKLLTTTVSQVSNALKVGVVDVAEATRLLVLVGWPEPLAMGVAQLQATQANVDRVKHAINQLRSAYHRGEITQLFVQEQMASIGITPQAVSSYLAAWQIERTPARKRRTAAKIVNDVAEGMLDTAQALVLLTNLGYEDADRELYMADARRKVVEVVGGASIADTLSGAQRDRTLAQLARHAGALSKTLIAEAKEQVSVAKLQKWASLGTIRKAEFVSRMRLYGYDDPTIELYWSEACAKKNAACEQPPVAPVTPVTPSAGANGDGEGSGGANPPVPE